MKKIVGDLEEKASRIYILTIGANNGQKHTAKNAKR